MSNRKCGKDGIRVNASELLEIQISDLKTEGLIPDDLKLSDYSRRYVIDVIKQATDRGA